ncbi:MAG: hypothetical protein JOZ58_21515 [Acetobacteraceae bacterium]|nr:hypothetical protein [Acetobacteraceae bacterium]
MRRIRRGAWGSVISDDRADAVAWLFWDYPIAQNGLEEQFAETHWSRRLPWLDNDQEVIEAILHSTRHK